MKRPELVIFDCDGVLVDSEPLAARCFSEALARIDIQRSAAELDRLFRGRRLDDCLGEVERWHGSPLPEGFAQQLQQRTFASLEQELEPVAGAEEALRAVRGDPDLELCVASSGEPGKIRLSLEVTGLAHHLGDAVFSALEVAAGKPAPDLFLHAARRMGVPPEDCIVIEDSDTGIEAAVAAGMRVIAYRPEDACAPPAGVPRLTRMDALPALLGAMGEEPAPKAC